MNGVDWSDDGSKHWGSWGCDHPHGIPAEVVQVREAQRMEGVRLAFEVLAWGQGDREGVLRIPSTT